MALFDCLEPGAPDDPYLRHLVWNRREIENYLCTRTTLETYARASAMAAEPRPLFARVEVDDRLTAMDEAVGQVSRALETLDKGSPWGNDLKVSDEFLTPLFKAYFERIGIPNLMSKKNFYELADYVPEEEIDPEIGEKLDAIATVAESARPAGEE